MTKKKEQPRDGNGKFAKKPMIGLHSKDGSIAFFTSVEEMEKFAKNNNITFKERSVSTKNPDCEPATKGYVKGLIRNTRGHEHEISCDGSSTVICMIFGWVITIILGICHSEFFVPFLLFSVVITCIVYELMKLECKNNVYGHVPYALQKHTLLHKDECGED